MFTGDHMHTRPVLFAISAIALSGLVAAGCSSPEEGGAAGATASSSPSTGGMNDEPLTVTEELPSEGLSDDSGDSVSDEILTGLSASVQNAVRSAESYLSFSAFSESGLIGQLEFEGYSKADATDAVAQLDVDWNEQAAKSAASYLSMSAFSESGLIEQLMFEGFTTEQAQYGAAAAYGQSTSDESAESGADSASARNAIRSAESYLNTGAFSRSGLINQLTFEGYSEADATSAVDSIDVDWNEQAARSAESYLRMSGFSRSSLIDQLMFEGYTKAQATYGADAAGL